MIDGGKSLFALQIFDIFSVSVSVCLVRARFVEISHTYIIIVFLSFALFSSALFLFFFFFGFHVIANAGIAQNMMNIRQVLLSHSKKNALHTKNHRRCIFMRLRQKVKKHKTLPKKKYINWQQVLT